MHGGRIQRIVAVHDAQEAGGLLERLGAQARHFPQRIASRRRRRAHRDGVTMFSASGRRQPGDARQQRRRCGVHIDAHGVHAILDHCIQRASQPWSGSHRADTGRRRWTSDRSSPVRPADPAGGARSIPRHAASHPGPETRWRPAPKPNTPRRRPPRRRSLVSFSSRMPLHQLGRQLVGFARGRAVADADQIHCVLLRQRGERRQRAVPVVARHDADTRWRFPAPCRCDRTIATLTPVRMPGSSPMVDARAGGRGQQQVVQVAREHPNRLFFGALAQLGEQLGSRAATAASPARSSALSAAARRRRRASDPQCR